jgi:hypothetical protein
VKDRNFREGNSPMLRRQIVVALLGAACGLAGCGGSDLPLVPVSGTVTFGGNSPPIKGSMVFNQVPGSGIEGLPRRPGRGRFSTDGRFAATTFRDGDGLLPGRYRIVIICVDGEPGPGRPFDQISFVPAGWEPEELVVEPDSGRITANFDVPPKKW